jgi:lipopolysaccharide/colanic/teichoic acid biosynthesis glycosyltransferase
MSAFRKRAALACKRIFDITVAGGALLALAPVIGLIALGIRLDDGGPVFFIQKRVGRGGNNFRCFKFRTMILGAENIGNRLTVTENDSRITRVGRLLRNWTMDEIPQLWNVLKGDMSIVGPRPWVPSQAAYCSVEDSRRFNFKPGMAGWAWIHGRNRLPWDERVRLDLSYVDHWSLRLDFSILARAFVLLFRRDGVYFAESAEQGVDSMEHGAGSLERRAHSSVPAVQGSGAGSKG